MSEKGKEQSDNKNIDIRVCMFIFVFLYIENFCQRDFLFDLWLLMLVIIIDLFCFILYFFEGVMEIGLNYESVFQFIEIGVVVKVCFSLVKLGWVIGVCFI